VKLPVRPTVLHRVGSAPLHAPVTHLRPIHTQSTFCSICEGFIIASVLDDPAACSEDPELLFLTCVEECAEFSLFCDVAVVAICAAYVAGDLDPAGICSLFRQWLRPV